MLNWGLGGLTVGFIGVMVLLISLHLTSRLPPLTKALATAVALFLCAVTYTSYPGLLGWPASASVLPSRLYLLGIQIEEPRRIYLWGRNLDQGTGELRPRAYQIPYSVSLHQKGEQAGAKMRRGLPIIVNNHAGAGSRLTTDENTPLDDSDHIEFIEAPEGLLPAKG